MFLKRFNWQIWAGFLLSLFAIASFPTIFVNWPVTRDFPWANLLLFAASLAFIAVGVRKAFGPERKTLSKIVAIVLSLIGVGSLALFIFLAFIMAKWLPASTGAPQVAGKAPDFTLSDTNGRQVSLNELRTTSVAGDKTRGVLLIFYRGYW